MKRVYIAGLITLALFCSMAIGWFLPFKYLPFLPAAGAETFWLNRPETHSSLLTPFIPAQIPGPLDTWAGQGPKKIFLQAPGRAGVIMNLAFRDIHDSAPPILKIAVGEKTVAEFRLPKGSGVFSGEESDLPPIFTRQAYISAQALAGSGRNITITLEDGSWAAFHSITFQTQPPWWLGLLTLLSFALTLYFYRLGKKPSIATANGAVEQNAEADNGKIWMAAGISALAGAFLIPGSRCGLFDGIPFVSVQETVTMMVILPSLLILGAGFFRSSKASLAAVSLLAIKGALFLWAPSEGMAMWVYDTPTELRSNAWRRTYDTLIHPGVSARITSPITQGSQLPVDWLWRRDSRFTLISYPFERAPRAPYEGGVWIAARAEAWVDVPEGRKLAFLTMGAAESRITLAGLDGRAGEFRGLRAIDAIDFNSADLIPPGVAKLTGQIIFSAEREKHYALIPVLISENGSMEDAFSAGAIWMDRESALSSDTRFAIAKWGAGLAGLGLIGFLAWWGIFTIETLFRLQRIDSYLLLISAAAAGAPFALAELDLSSGSIMALYIIPSLFAAAIAYWMTALAAESGASRAQTAGAALAAGAAGLLSWPILTQDCWGGAWTPPGLAALGAGALFIHWSRSRRDASADESPWRPFCFLAGMMIFPWFIWRWSPYAGLYFPYDDLSDSLTYQTFAREIFVEGDWWHKAGEPVFFYQPGFRYVAGALHTLFGQSFFAQNLLELWSILLTCAALGMIGRWAGLGSLASAMAGLIYLIFLFGPHFMNHLGLGMQELTANIFFFGLIILIIKYQGEGKWMTIAGLLAVASFFMRFDRLGAAAACVLFAMAPAQGAMIQAWGDLIKEFARRWKSSLVYLTILFAGVMMVMFRNYLFGGEFALLYRENMNLLGCKDLACSMRAYQQIITGSISCVDRSALVMAPGVFLALIAMIFRPRWLRGIPVSFGLLILGLLSPYYFGGPTNFEPKFSMHLLPLTSIITVIAIISILRGQSSREA